MTGEAALLEEALEHHRNGRFVEAETIYWQVLEGNSLQVDALYLLGCLKQQAGGHQQAVELLQKVVDIEPDEPEYWYALGLAYDSLGEAPAAEDSFRRVMALSPEHGNALAALGRAIRASNRKSREAAEFLERASGIMPDQSDVVCEAADAWLEAGEARRAARIYEQLLHRQPKLPRAWFGKGCAATRLEEFVEAKTCFAQALELAPEWLEAKHNQARALYELGHVSDSFSLFRQCSEMEWPESKQASAVLAVIVPGVPEIDNAGILEIRSAWARQYVNSPKAIRNSVGARPRKIGYISSFFQRDNWMKPVWGLINQHDRTVVRIHLFSDCAASKIQHGYRAHSEDRFFDTSELSNGEMASLIGECGIDVLVDLNGYSNMRRLPLFARRMAPVTIGWFNFYATSGMEGFDYLIGDSEVVPQDEEQFYSEKILRVSGSYLTFEVSYPVPPVVSRPSGERSFIYGALGSQYKMTDEVIEAWCRILQAAPGSLLLIKNTQIRSMTTANYLAGRFQKFGVAADRLRFEGPEAHFDFLRAYERVDLALDTFPYNGGTTTTEALWQGVPVVTFHGDRWASRTSASILRAGGLGEFVVRDVDAYVELAVELGNAGRDHLADLRMGMRDKLMGSAVCDTRRFAAEMEAIYEACCSGVGV